MFLAPFTFLPVCIIKTTETLNFIYSILKLFPAFQKYWFTTQVCNDQVPGSDPSYHLHLHIILHLKEKLLCKNNNQYSVKYHYYNFRLECQRTSTIHWVCFFSLQYNIRYPIPIAIAFFCVSRDDLIGNLGYRVLVANRQQIIWSIVLPATYSGTEIVHFLWLYFLFS